MKSADFLIVGGSAAGTTAAETIRNLLPDSSISIVSDENHEQYSRVLIPHYIRGKVERVQVFLKKQDWYKEKNIELVKGVRVKELDGREKTVLLSNGEQVQYGKLLIAIGGYAVPLKIPGSDLGNIFYMRTIDDADKIIESAKKSKSAVVLGGGFIGLEFASCFKMNGVSDITLLVREDYYWKGKLDNDSSKVLQKVLEKNGIKIAKLEEADHIESKDGHVSAVVAKSGMKFEADIVGVGIGIKSDFSFLDGSSIKINRGIVTNEYLETSVPDIYAAGDCAEFHDVIFERDHIIGNWANATSQGAAVGRTMAGEKTVFETASSYSINFFGPPMSDVGGSCTFIGVTDEDFVDEIVSRGSTEEDKMTRIFIKEIGGVMRAVGATVINSVSDVSPLTTAIKGKIDISNFKQKLSDSSFDLKEVLS